MNLTTLERVKQFLGYDAPGTAHADDAKLTAIIAGVSAQVIAYLGRHAVREEHVGYFDVECGQTEFQLRGYPVNAIGGIKSDSTREFPNGSELASDTYTFSPKTGRLVIDRTTLAEGARALEVTYTGGLAADVAALVADASMADLVMAAELQVAFLWRRKGLIGTSGASTPQGGSVTLDKNQGAATSSREEDLIPEVKGLLTRHRLPETAVREEE